MILRGDLQWIHMVCNGLVIILSSHSATTGVTSVPSDVHVIAKLCHIWDVANSAFS